jgi:hypothetical protein
VFSALSEPNFAADKNYLKDGKPFVGRLLIGGGLASYLTAGLLAPKSLYQERLALRRTTRII